MLVEVERLLVIAEGVPHGADVVEGGCLAAFVADLAAERQRLLVEVERLLVDRQVVTTHSPMLLRVVASFSLSPCSREIDASDLLMIHQRCTLVATLIMPTAKLRS